MVSRLKLPEGPKILVFDIETAPREFRGWSPKTDFIPHGQLKRDSFLLSFAAWWKGTPRSEVIYMDQRNERNIENDFKLVEKILDLMDEADFVEGYNSDRFDIRTVNARAEFHRARGRKLALPRSFIKVDVMKIVKKHYELPYYNMDYVSKYFGLKGKYKTKQFRGMELWDECEKGNMRAWAEMRKYNIQDVFRCDEILDRAAPWHNMPNLDIFHEGKENVCWCGCKEFKSNGTKELSTGVYQRWRCKNCGHEKRSRKNLLEKTKKSFLLIAANR